MSEEAAKARIELWLAPIAGAAPAGPDARYEPLHEQVRSEAAKLDNPAGGVPDWKRMVKSAEELTSQKSKDLLIQSYAAYALYQTEGLQGLASGMFLLAESMDRFWDGMHPPAARIRARVNALQWLTDKLDVALQSAPPPGPADASAVHALDAAMRRLRGVVNERFTDQAPALRPIAEAIERIKMSVPEGAPSAAAPAAEAVHTTMPAPPPEAAGAPAPIAAPAPPPEAAPAAPPPKPEVNLEGELADRAKPYLDPCPGDSPAGIDAKFDPLHEELRNQVAAFDSPSATPIDWPRFAPKAGTVLKEKSKDLLIASYLAYALWQSDKLRGLATGLEIITQICERYWDTCFPPLARIRGRASALGWLISRVETVLPDVNLTSADKHVVDLLDTATKRFGNVVRDKFEDAAPPYRSLLEAVQRLKMSVPEEAPPPPPPRPAAVAQPAQAAAAPSAPAASAPSGPAASVSLGGEGATLADPKEVTKFSDTISKSLLDAARMVRDAAPADPTSYLFTRVALILGTTLPEIIQGSETRAPPPNDQMLKGVDQQLRAQAWLPLINTAEGNLVSKRYWLEMSRVCALALTNLGPEYAKAKNGVIAGTALWVKAFPELVELTYKGGMPFATDMTKEWIATEVMPSAGGGAKGEGGGEGSEAISEARSLAAGGKVDEALAALANVAHGARSGRAKFRARLAMAQALASGATSAAAEGLFDVLVEEIEATGLERWEPELAAECYRSQLACLKAAKKPNDAAMSQQTALVYRRLCRVDPIAAVKAGV